MRPSLARYRVLIVDDEPSIRKVLSLYLASEGIESRECGNGLEAWEVLQGEGESFDAVLLDRNMPGMNGLELLRRIKEDPRLGDLPAIFQTSADDPREVLEGLKGGAFYYLTKPVKQDMLLAVVRTALQDQQRFRELRETLRESARTLTLLERGLFRVRTLHDAHSLTGLLANACPDPDAVAVGLSELILNGVVHGNLELSYDETTACLEGNRLGEEVRARQEDPRYSHRWVEVRFDRLPGRIRFTIQDQGKGFDWRKYLDFSPDRIFDNHGRGIAMARAQSFSRIEYLGKGNVVVAEVDFEEG